MSAAAAARVSSRSTLDPRDEFICVARSFEKMIE